MYFIGCIISFILALILLKIVFKNEKIKKDEYGLVIAFLIIATIPSWFVIIPLLIMIYIKLKEEKR